MPTRQHEISRADAEKKIENFIKIKEQFSQSQFVNSLPDLARAFALSQSLSFAFYKDQLDASFAAAPGANALRVYMAANDSGEPTLVVVPCYVNPNETLVQNKFSDENDGGNQYPFIIIIIITNDPFKMDNDDGEPESDEEQE